MHIEREDMALMDVDELHYHIVCILQQYIMKLRNIPKEIPSPVSFSPEFVDNSSYTISCLFMSSFYRDGEIPLINCTNRCLQPKNVYEPKSE